MGYDLFYIIEVLLNGLLAGGTYALIAVSMTVVFGVLKLMNFGHGALVTIGFYSAVVAVSWGIDPYLAIVPAAVLMAIVALLAYYALIDTVISKPALTQVVFTLGLGIVIEAAIEIIWTANPRVAPSALSGVLFMGDVMVSRPRIIGFVASILLAVGFWALLRWTWWGMAIRAVAQHDAAARLIGIPRTKTLAIAFALSAVAAVVAGLLIAPSMTISPYAGHVFLGIAFGAVVIGTKGNVMGAFVGGMIVGLFEAAAIAFIGDDFKEAAIFGLILVFLLVRPDGLFGKRANV
ncbi:MAG: branched-chain amino acid ABC transporter permease [Rhizobiaceae bacterium]|nr:branched-chain amino acid ABC transporter permease [Rhizobiaceae bacterium]